MSAPKRTNIRTWDQIMQTESVLSNPFANYDTLLAQIGATPDDAKTRMWITYEDAITNYTADTIADIFRLNLIANGKKYNDLIDLYQTNFYPFADKTYVENYSHERTPDLKSKSESSWSGSADNERKQSRTTTTTPGVTTTTTHSVNPYDNVGLRDESQDTSTESGSRSTVESYSGLPDHTSTSSSAESTVTTTGTETNTYTKTYQGRTGQRPTSDVIADGIKAAAMHDILDIIISDIGDQIFIQAWLPLF